MSSHFQSSQFGASHFASSHFGRLLVSVIVLDGLPGGSSDPAQIAKQIAPKVVDPMLRAKLLREDEEMITIILAFMETLDE